jgi:Ca-activated chloride channel homolog
MKTNLILLLISALNFLTCANATPVVITGKVTEKNKTQALPGVTVQVKGTTQGTSTDAQGFYKISTVTGATLVFSFIGYLHQEQKIGKKLVVNVALEADTRVLQEVVVTGYPRRFGKQATHDLTYATPPVATMMVMDRPNAEEYKSLGENIFHDARKQPLTTFSIDVDRAAYSNIRRMLNTGQMPPRDAVRIEEMINYFDYAHVQPTGQDPVNIQTETSDSPWNKGLKLLRIGLQAKTIATDNLPASNLVFLIDVSGSMSDANKLPLVIESFKLLVNQLRANDRVAIVVYAGAAGVVLPSTAGSQKTTIKDALNRLQAGGSTAGGAGISLAYQIAEAHFVKGGNNRVILATDGDFNVGTSSEGELQNLIEEKSKSGVFLSVLGFGMGNYKDNKMETLADKGNGNYAYIDNLQEGQKVFVKEFGGTLFTVAKDVKLQLEFNPRFVKAYRLIGYENRMLQNEDFHDDKKDAGEMGSGHNVTALYEIIPAGIESVYLAKVDDLKYQKTPEVLTQSDEMLTIKLRYKQPDSDKSQLLEVGVRDTHIPFAKTSADFRFAAAVAEFGLLLRESNFKGKANYAHIIETAQNATTPDPEGYRGEFVRLIKLAENLKMENEERKTAEK